jgi:hypothetical protein
MPKGKLQESRKAAAQHYSRVAMQLSSYYQTAGINMKIAQLV